ncbi:hypothetical protein HGA13_29750 [Nocardia speluncae]|uniref:Uncharacterized protein n=1 Tax=Nocardia speluncae TaxID=419477 RepID=A0A846XPK1_9NOCA|nr:hypothetical protein [Nocardia speluncae]NKY37225.1 hypothetical protein [Nocardia speluncae]
MPNGVREPSHPHPDDRQRQRTTTPQADVEIILIDEADSEALTQQQAAVLLEIAHWQADRTDARTTRL